MFEIKFLISDYYINKQFDSYFHFSELNKMILVDWESRYIQGAIIITYNDISILDTTQKQGSCYPIPEVLNIIDGFSDYIVNKEAFINSGEQGTFFITLSKKNENELLYINHFDKINIILPEKEFLKALINQAELFYKQIYDLTLNQQYKTILTSIKNLNAND